MKSSVLILYCMVKKNKKRQNDGVRIDDKLGHFKESRMDLLFLWFNLQCFVLFGLVSSHKRKIHTFDRAFLALLKANARIKSLKFSHKYAIALHVFRIRDSNSNAAKIPFEINSIHSIQTEHTYRVTSISRIVT